MAPEQIRADATIDGRADLFSLGAVLYEMLTGRPPFTGETVHEIMEQVLSADPPRPGTVNARLAPELDALVMRLLAKKPGDRFPSARSLFRELRRLEERLEERTTREAADEAEAAAASAGAPGSSDGDKTLVLAAAPAPPARRATLSTPRVVAFVGAAIVLAGVALIPLRLQFSDANARRTEVAAAAAPAVVDAPPAPASEPVPPEPPPAAEPPPPPEPVKAAPAPPPKPAAAAHKPAKHARAPAPPPRAAHPPAPPVQVAAQPPRPVPARPQTAKVLLNVSPWGDVYVNGKRQGTTPPLSVLELPPGRHRLEIRNSALPPYLTEITVQAGASVSVQYTFQN
jgi:serine/threonine-protein kinase